MGAWHRLVRGAIIGLLRVFWSADTVNLTLLVKKTICSDFNKESAGYFACAEIDDRNSVNIIFFIRSNLLILIIYPITE